MNHKNKIIIYLFISLLLVGCKSKSYDKDILKKKDIAPKDLKELSSGIDEILTSIGNIERIGLNLETNDKDEEQDKGKEEEQDKGKEEDSSKKEDEKDETLSTQSSEGNLQDSSKDTKDDPDKKEIKDKKIESMWKKIDKELEKLYFSWNDYAIKAVKKGAASENLDEIEESLNKLTRGIERRESLTTYNYGSKVLKALEPIYQMYRDEVGGEIGGLKYMVYQYHINATKDSKNTALLYISDSEDYINKIRVKIEDEKEKVEKLDKISFAFKNLSKSLDEDSRRLLIIKKDVLIGNLNSLEN